MTLDILQAPLRSARQPVKAKPPEVGLRIKRLRLSVGLSQREIQEPGTSYAYISRIEAGTRNPSLEALIQIAQRLGVTGLYLLTGRNDSKCPFCGRSHQ